MINQRAQDILNEADEYADRRWPHENEMDNPIKRGAIQQYLLARLIGALEWIG